jgi:DEAD/DEAH box helicase domain-containing protein
VRVIFSEMEFRPAQANELLTGFGGEFDDDSDRLAQAAWKLLNVDPLLLVRVLTPWLEQQPGRTAARQQLLALKLQIAEAKDAQVYPRQYQQLLAESAQVWQVDEYFIRRSILERARLLALREYVPGTQLLAGGRLITSRGLLKHWMGADLDNYLGVRGQYVHCRNGHVYYEISQPLGECPLCGAGMAHDARQLLLPRHGVERVGSVERATITFAKTAGQADLAADDFAGVAGLAVRYREAGEIFVYNQGAQNKGFTICLQCGYADSEDNLTPAELPRGFSTHARLTAVKEHHRCWGQTAGAVLRNQTLAARETTDVLLLAFSGGLQALAKDEALLQTLGYALQIAGARLLELDSREIGVMLAAAGEFGDGLGIVLYDNAPGGAGHVRELFAHQRRWLAVAADILFVNEQHDERCETACLDCLLTYDAQEAMHKGLLQRRTAYLAWRAVLCGQSLNLAPSLQPKQGEEMLPSVPALAGPDKEERLAKAHARRRSLPQ